MFRLKHLHVLHHTVIGVKCVASNVLSVAWIVDGECPCSTVDDAIVVTDSESKRTATSCSKQWRQAWVGISGQAFDANVGVL